MIRKPLFLLLIGDYEITYLYANTAFRYPNSSSRKDVGSVNNDIPSSLNDHV